jgi:hypothetical protein
MMLYDIFYADRSFDRCTALPAKAEAGARAENVNWDGHVYYAHKGEWISKKEFDNLN